MEFINSAQCVVLTIKLSLIPILTICHNSNVIHFHTGIDRIGRATKNTQIKKTQANPKWQSVIYLFCSISSDRMKLQMKTAKQHTNKKKINSIDLMWWIYFGYPACYVYANGYWNRRNEWKPFLSVFLVSAFLTLGDGGISLWDACSYTYEALCDCHWWGEEAK